MQSSATFSINEKKDYEEMQIPQNNHKVLHSNHKEMKYQDREEKWQPLVS